MDLVFLASASDRKENNPLLIKIPARIPMMEITTKSSIRVNPVSLLAEDFFELTISCVLKVFRHSLQSTWFVGR